MLMFRWCLKQRLDFQPAKIECQTVKVETSTAGSPIQHLKHSVLEPSATTIEVGKTCVRIYVVGNQQQFNNWGIGATFEGLSSNFKLNHELTTWSGEYVLATASHGNPAGLVRKNGGQIEVFDWWVVQLFNHPSQEFQAQVSSSTRVQQIYWFLDQVNDWETLGWLPGLFGAQQMVNICVIAA